jgi:hypothetical protein
MMKPQVISGVQRRNFKGGISWKCKMGLEFFVVDEPFFRPEPRCSLSHDIGLSFSLMPLSLAFMRFYDIHGFSRESASNYIVDTIKRYGYGAVQKRGYGQKYV